MAVRVAINGFGRIGRLFFRVAVERGVDLEFVSVNDLAVPEMLAHLLRYGSVHGRFLGTVEVGEGKSIVNGKEIKKVLSQPDPAKLPWKNLDVYLIICSFIRATLISIMLYAWHRRG